MYTSPCAKLMSRKTPYTIVYPSAMSAYTVPMESPLMSCCKKSCMSIRLNRIRQMRFAPADFQNHDWLLRVMVFIDRDIPPGPGEILGLRDRISDRIPIRRARPLDRVEHHPRRVVSRDS